MSETIPVLVVEDNRLLREGIAAIVNSQPDLRVVALANDLHEAVRVAPEVKPRVVLVDAALGEFDGRTCVEHIKRAAPQARLIVMDLLPINDDIVEFVRAGASGFVLKTATDDEIVTAVRLVASGRDVLPTAMTGTLFNRITRQAVTLSAPEVINAVRMTRREREVIDLIAAGLGNKEIAGRLNLSPHTVKTHVRHILEKLALHTRLELAAATHRASWQAGAGQEVN